MTARERLDRHDREISAIRKLVHTGMKLIVRIQEIEAATRKDLRELAAAQKRTEKNLDALISSLRIGGNGHTTRKVDLQ